MKKLIIVSAFFCLGLAPVAAQDDAEQGDEKVALLPQAGDFALGVDANPFANLFNGTQGLDLYFGDKRSLYGIYGKYFLTDKQAVRAKVLLNVTSDIDKEVVVDDSNLAQPQNLNPDATTIDSRKTSSTEVWIHLGYEWRRGYRRVQGFYGGEVMLGYGNGSRKYTYGNPITAVNTNPTSYNFDSNLYPQTANGYRVLERKDGATFGVGLGAFVGAEYFLAPKLSIGGEVGLGFKYYTQGQSEVTEEYALNNSVFESARRTSGGYSSAGFGVTPYGNVFLLFHF
ncbi:MAG: hypothetical protein LBU62_02745 [Bacteroidales bacterium]|jgi:hypothetical protein|nr:hypothetical protein [Bacteroidales bacterium]